MKVLTSIWPAVHAQGVEANAKLTFNPDHSLGIATHLTKINAGTEPGVYMSKMSAQQR
jgi:hypothetical protein